MDDEWRPILRGEQAHTYPEGVGGWLLYFCVVSVLISPLASLNAILKPLNVYWLACYVGLVIISISAGFATLVQSQAAPNFIRLYLIAKVLYGLAQIGWARHLHSSHQSATIVGSEFGRAIGTLLGAALWFWYFKVSTRVRRTFGSNI